MKKKVTEDLSTEQIEPRVYEVSFWLVPTISESDLPAHFDRLKKVISDAQGEHISEEAPYMREMTYQMVRVIENVNKRFDDGYFGWVKFRVTPQSAVEIKNLFEKDITIIRSLLIETVEGNTTYTQRPDSKVLLTEEVVEATEEDVQDDDSSTNVPDVDVDTEEDTTEEK